ncbi:ATPase [Synergistales bacterium]|nr:ATPase [Synergistales bacterium]
MENASIDELTPIISLFLDKHRCVKPFAKNAIRSLCLAAAKNSNEGRGIYTRGRKRLQKIFGLSAEAAVICEFVFISHSFKQVEEYFQDSLHIFEPAYRRLFSTILHIDLAKLRKCIHELISYGILTSYPCLVMSDEVLMLWESSESGAAEELLYKPLKGPCLPLENFGVPQDALSHVRALLESDGDAPLHILFYGPPGTGKTTCARSLARALGIKAWSAPCPNEGSSRRAALIACLQMASKHKKAFVLMDEAERFLDTQDHEGRESIDKAWINEFMDTTGRRVIWIANDISDVDQSIRRRFTFSVCFDQPGSLERKRLWMRILHDNHVSSRISESRTEKLAREYRVSAAVIENAVRQAKNLGHGKRVFADTLERVISAHITLRDNGRKPRVDFQYAGNFTTDGVCAEGSLDELLEACSRIDAMRRKGETIIPGGATMLFYGPPGTGKSALARYLSDELNKELIVKRASALLDPRVGMSERYVAEAFRAAEREDAVLLIDEADSFLYSRDAAARSWENTLVNEFSRPFHKIFSLNKNT